MKLLSNIFVASNHNFSFEQLLYRLSLQSTYFNLFHHTFYFYVHLQSRVVCIWKQRAEWLSLCWAEQFITLNLSGFLQLFQGVYQDGRHPSQLRQQRRQTHGVRSNTRCVLWHSLIKRVLDWDAPMASFMANQLFLQMASLILLYVSVSCWLTEMLQCYRHFYKLSSSLIRQPNLKKL